MNEDLIERIQKYLSGEFSEEERSLFESEINSSEELKKQVDFLRDLNVVIKANSRTDLKKRMQEIEAELQNDEAILEPAASRPANAAHASSANSGPTILSYFAIAASVLLVLGMFFLFKDSILKQSKEIAKTEQGKVEKDSTTHVFFGEIPITSISDSKFGFVNDTSKTVLHLIIEKPIVIDSTTVGIFYKQKNDTLYLRSSETNMKPKLYEFYIEEARAEKEDKNGQVIEVIKPELKGFYLEISNEFYEIKNSANYVPLYKVDSAKKELLQFYTNRK